MDTEKSKPKNTALVLVVALVAIVAVAFLWIYRGGGKIELGLPFDTSVKLEGTNPEPVRPGHIVGEDLKAGKDITAQGNAGGDVEVRRAEAGGTISLGREAGEAVPAPK